MQEHNGLYYLFTLGDAIDFGDVSELEWEMVVVQTLTVV